MKVVKRLMLVSLILAAITASVIRAQISVDSTGSTIVGTETNTVSSNTWHAQWFYQMFKFLDFGSSATADVQAVGFSSYIDCTRRQKIVIHAEGSQNNTTITIRLWFDHHNATRADSPTESFSLVHSGVQEGANAEALNSSYYHFIAATMDVLPGAQRFKVEIVTVSNGTGKVWARAV